MQSTPTQVPGTGGRFATVATLLLVNAIPPAGLFLFGWSGANLLVLYWIENLLLAFATSALIARHARVTGKRGHLRAHLGLQVNGKAFAGGFGAEYRTAALVFTLAHGLFVAVVVFGLGRSQPEEPMWHLQPRELLWGALAIAALVVLELWVELRGIGQRSFAWMREHARSRLGRVVVLHLTLILGLWAVLAFDLPLALLLLLVGLKLLNELGAALAPAKATMPAEPPAWALAAADRLARDTGGADAARKRWQADRQRAAREREEDELPVRT